MSRLREISPVRQLASNIALNAGKAFDLVNYAWAMSGLSLFGAKTAKQPAEKPQLPIPTIAEALAAATGVAAKLSKLGISSEIGINDETGDVTLKTSD